MRILFDQGTPVPLKGFLSAHEVATAHEHGWGMLQNGDLLRAAETAGFAVIITTDQNLRYRQNLAERRLAIIVLRTTSWPVIRLHAALVVEAVSHASIGSYQELTFPPPVR